MATRTAEDVQDDILRKEEELKDGNLSHEERVLLRKELLELRTQQSLLLQQAQAIAVPPQQQDASTADWERMKKKIYTKFHPYVQSLQHLHERVGTRDSKWLHLPDGCSWPGRLQHKEPIMIRPSYIVAMRLLDARFGLAPAVEAAAGADAGTSGTAGTKTAASSIRWAVIITGQPGIGKSSLGYVYAHMLAKRNKVFIWDYLEEGGIRVRLRFDFRGVDPLLEVGAATAFTDEVMDGEVDLLIQDNMVPGGVHTARCNTLVLSSPRPGEFVKFGKEYVATYHLPSLLPAEQQIIFSYLWPNAGLRDLKAFQYYHGGTARAMDPTNKVQLQERQQKVEDPVKNISLDALATTQEQQSSEHTLSHRVLAFKVDRKKLKALGLVLASKYVEDLLLEQGLIAGQGIIARIMKNVKGGGGTWWADLFELFALVAFAKGGIFPAKQLGGGDAQAQPLHKVGRIARSHSSPGAMATHATDEEDQQLLQQQEETSIYEEVEEQVEELQQASVPTQQTSQQHAQQQAQQQAERGEGLCIRVPTNISRHKDEDQPLDPRQTLLLMAAVNQPGWDAALAIDGDLYILQMTVGARHPVQMQAIVELLQRCNPAPKQAYMCFVVPSERFFTYKEQDWHTRKGTKAERVHPSLKRVQQWAVLIDDTRLKRRSEDG